MVKALPWIGNLYGLNLSDDATGSCWQLGTVDRYCHVATSCSRHTPFCYVEVKRLVEMAHASDGYRRGFAMNREGCV